MKLHRHGEVVLKPTTLPKKAKLVEEKKSVIVGHSESGHHHVLTATAPIKVLELEGRTYLDVPLEAKLSHQKVGTETHGTQVIAPGVYERVIKRSWSYAEKIMKKTID
jgi:hypothetical protein